MQPAYLPWLGYFDRLQKSDLHIVLDDVNIDSNSKTKFANRNKIRTKDSWSWLTVPLQSKGKHGNLILSEAKISTDASWRKKHLNAIKHSYARSAFYSKFVDFFEDYYTQDWQQLSTLVEASTSYLSNSLGINCPTVKSSSLKHEGQKDRLILNLCVEAGATEYISGPLGRGYLEEKIFEERGIKIIYHDYNHPIYNQSFLGFESHMSIIDLLFNHGPESLGILST